VIFAGYGRQRSPGPWTLACVPHIHLVTDLDAPPERAFDAALDLDLEVRAGAPYGLRIAPGSGRAGGIIALGETVTWQATHFGVPVRHTSRIVALDRPRSFVDVMERGVFAAFRHEHTFDPLPGGRARMTDDLYYRAPLGALGRLVERLAVDRRLRRLLAERNTEISTACRAAR
jgi:ligand-binding SRPBCC domain-containing protein